ncbi:polysaccharide deacetylase, partial [Helicobacter pylori]
MTKEILVAYGMELDAVEGWLGGHGGEDETEDIG